MEKNDIPGAPEKNNIWLKYLTLPVEVAFNPDLNKNDCIIFCIINILDGPDDHCFASNNYIAKLIGVSETTVSTSISRLIELKYIDRLSVEGVKRVIKINANFKDLYRASLKVFKVYLERSLKHNNIVIEESKSSFHDDKRNAFSVPGSGGVFQDSSSNITQQDKPYSNKLYRQAKERRLPPSPSQKDILKEARQNNPPQETKSKHIPKVSQEIQEILDHWKDNNLHVSGLTTKEHLKSVKKLRKLIKGKLFDREYTLEDIKLSMNRFAIATHDPTVFPANKKTYKALSISSFIDSPFIGNGTGLFRKYLTEEPQFIPNYTVTPVEDKFPELTKHIKKSYVAGVLNGAKVQFSPIDENNFRKAAIRINKFLDDNQHMMAPYTELDDSIKSAYLIKSIVNDVEDTDIKITTGFLCSDFTFNNRFPRQLTNSSIFIDDNFRRYNNYEYAKPPVDDDNEEDWG
jgi:hypothetical protein